MSRASFVLFESKDAVDSLMNVCTAFTRNTNPGDKLCDEAFISVRASLPRSDLVIRVS